MWGNVRVVIYNFLKRLKSGTEDETNGRHIVAALGASLCPMPRPNVLDIGAGYGTDLLNTGQAMKTAGNQPLLYAIESFPNAVSHLVNLGVDVHAIDIERSALPFANEFFDLVICNQVLEHTKEIFWIVSELTRVTKVGGKLIIGVPNLGSLHNRISLLFGAQPPAIHVFGPHVRGYTVPGMTDFLERGGILKIKKVLGANFYPFRPYISRPISRAFPRFSVSCFYVVERVQRGTFLSVFDTDSARELADTPYFRGYSSSDFAETDVGPE
jgi:SAM-dependent methyltransferase